MNKNLPYPEEFKIEAVKQITERDHKVTEVSARTACKTAMCATSACPRRASLPASSCSAWCKRPTACRSDHEVFDGNTAEVPTLEPTLKKVLARYHHICRLVVVADRGFATSR